MSAPVDFRFKDLTIDDLRRRVSSLTKAAHTTEKYIEQGCIGGTLSISEYKDVLDMYNQEIEDYTNEIMRLSALTGKAD